MALEVYIDRVLENVGLARQTSLNLLRWYLKTITREAFAEAVEKINDIRKLKILWEAGLDGEQQKLVLKRYDELVGKQHGAERMFWRPPRR